MARQSHHQNLGTNTRWSAGLGARRVTHSYHRGRVLAAAICISALVTSPLPGIPASAQTSPSAPPVSVGVIDDPSASPTTTVPPWDATPEDPSTAIPAPPPQDPSRPKGFDEKASKVVAAETTPTKLVYDNPDGSRTAKLSIAPQRFKDGSGKWVDYDLNIVARSDGSLGAKAAPAAATLNKKAEGGVATVATSAGPVVLRHPEAATAATAAVDKNEASYAKALTGGRDLKIALTPTGFEESVVLPDANAPATYRDELVLPTGVTVRQAKESVELLNKAGAVIATFGGGFAHDADFPGGAVPTPVSVRLVSQKGNVATVEVSITDPTWLSAPGRKFPVTIDPDFTQGTAPGWGGMATMVIQGTAADPGPSNTAYYGSLALGAGRYVTGNVYRMLLEFPAVSSSIPANSTVLTAGLYLYNNYTGFSYSCTPQPMQAWPLAAGFNAATTWNTQPAVAGAPLAIDPFVHQPYPNGAGTNCLQQPNWQALNVAPIVQGWVNGSPNWGLELRADEANQQAFQQFWSAHAYSGQVQPYLYVTYDRLPNPPANVAAVANADGSVTVNWTASTVPPVARRSTGTPSWPRTPTAATPAISPSLRPPAP